MSDSPRDWLLPAVAAFVLAALAGGGYLAYAGWNRLRANESHHYVTDPTPLSPAITTTTPPIASTTPAIPLPLATETDTSTVTSPPPSTTGTAEIPNAERVIAGMRPGFRRCYNKGLGEDPSMKGSMVIAIRIAANGDVTSASKVGGSGLSPAVESCILARVHVTTFDATPSGGSIRVPITFVSAK